MRSRLSIISALFVALTFSLAAQQEHKMSAEEKAMMDAMAKAVAPGPEHKMLDSMAGTFNTVVRYYPAPGAPAIQSSGVSTNKLILGGRYLEQRFKGTSMGQPFEGIGYTGYDKLRKQYVGSWIDNMSTSPMTTTGQVDSAGKNWNFKGTMDDPMSGQAISMTEKLTVVDKDKHIFEMWMPSREGTPYKSMEIVYTRKKK